ncbi:corA [Symbiodinium natans]|uniref:CorA protein n=1 Tax=Symbiodinium natans TaxID=878477 RepID=A0A812R2I1_9DINO|nr:corA [Symbiodinium natans]
MHFRALAILCCLAAARGSCPAGQEEVNKTWQISASEDDFEVSHDLGAVSLTDTDLELGADMSPDSSNNVPGKQTIFLMFRNVDLASDATVNFAHVVFTVDGTGGCCDEPLEVTAKMALVSSTPNATALTAQAALNIYENMSTSANVTYAPDLHLVLGAEVSTPDLSAPLREVLAQSSWGNWVLVMFGNSNSTRGPESREYETFDGTQPAAAAKLVVGTCQVPQGGVSSARTRSLGVLLFSFLSLLALM